jgi:hypothetical protein
MPCAVRAGGDGETESPVRSPPQRLVHIEKDTDRLATGKRVFLRVLLDCLTTLATMAEAC